MWSFFEFLNDDDCTLTILDVGASLLGDPAYQRLIDMKRARLIGFEPDPEACRQLNARYGAPHRFYPYFLGNGKPGIYHQTNWGPTGSLFKPNTPLLEMFQALAELTVPVAEHPVATTRLDDIAEIDDVDFIKIDVQGSELDIFKNAAHALSQAVLIQTEVSFVECYEGQPMFSDVDAFLRHNGFQFHDVVGVGLRAFKPLNKPAEPSAGPSATAFRQKIWGDVYYVKDWMHLESVTPRKLVRMAALLHDLAGSYDLAHLALCAMDKQTGGDIAQRYLTRLQEGGLCTVETGQQLDSEFFPVKEERRVGETDYRELPETSDRPPITLQTIDGIAVSVPGSLNCITTYVLLEQEQWFEREIQFLCRWLKPGMNGIDIGANVGVYSLPLARCVAPDGRIFAFEPGTANRKHLELGRSQNELDNLSISACALADTEKDGWLQIASSGEVNSLSEGPVAPEHAERVTVSALDALERQHGWPSIDFVKIDAEGQEARIVAGGRDFFRRQSPLVMYEVANGGTRNNALRWIFEALGYVTYRLLGDASCLVPVGSDEAQDFFELNLFAAKPDRAASIAARGLLVAEIEEFVPRDEERNEAIKGLLNLPYARSFEFSKNDLLACEYGEALVAYAAYRFAGLAPGRRHAALCSAFEQLREYCNRTPTSTGLASLARAALDLGHRQVAVDALKRLLSVTGEQIDQPFFPACLRYENVPCEGREAEWFSAAAIEQLELSQELSSLFSNEGLGRLQSLCESPFTSAEMSRRVVLRVIRAGDGGMGGRELSKYVNSEHRHCNPSYWAPPSLSKIVALL